jgi:hypothetical protein
MGIPEVSTLPADTVASEREATEGRANALKVVTLAQENIVRERVMEGGSQAVIFLGV